MLSTRAQQSSKVPLSRRLTALVALALFCWLNLLATSPTVHHDTCGSDSNSSQHHCAATVLSKGQVTPAVSAVSAVLLVAPAPISVLRAEIPAPVYSSPARTLPLGRAPPFLLA